ncbi:ProQ/FinO family protein [Xenorhabdus bovienii]|uniref:ProQ/FinO family protein n=1 Tax=Xenorhabdus bovienii TaxID=40576 RepID=UPI0023B3059B|nr:ProQ/FinO family protein [Xenorhabdus bovienii]MDE9483871.1 ProQ/FinO family protein [Xenorhabdus bovienii]
MNGYVSFTMKQAQDKNSTMATWEEKKQAAREARALLEGFWSTLFCYRVPRPLKVGVLDDLVSDAKARGLPFDKEILRKALVNYTIRYRYQKALAKGGKRYGLDGKADGVVTDEQQEYAKGLIIQRDAKAVLAKNLKK